MSTRTSRRRVIAAALATPIPAATTAAPLPPGRADTALRAAERCVAEMLSEKGARAPLLTVESEQELMAPLSAKQYAAEDFIALTAPETLHGAAVKLRWLADEIGVITGDFDGTDNAGVCCRQVLALIERNLA
jgi:hypothetical protein